MSYTCKFKSVFDSCWLILVSWFNIWKSNQSNHLEFDWLLPFKDCRFAWLRGTWEHWPRRHTIGRNMFSTMPPSADHKIFGKRTFLSWLGTWVELLTYNPKKTNAETKTTLRFFCFYPCFLGSKWTWQMSASGSTQWDRWWLMILSMAAWLKRPVFNSLKLRLNKMQQITKQRYFEHVKNMMNNDLGDHCSWTEC